jgi:hypothetical protein
LTNLGSGFSFFSLKEPDKIAVGGEKILVADCEQSGQLTGLLYSASDRQASKMPQSLHLNS